MNSDLNSKIEIGKIGIEAVRNGARAERRPSKDCFRALASVEFVKMGILEKIGKVEKVRKK